ncbi:hypothetical protein C8R44DRAFT_794972 [Mycena epipterygia]|nr:hypothetical protein C8R44DRAFT_794972 [Mycena epipterygia]
MGAQLYKWGRVPAFCTSQNRLGPDSTMCSLNSSDRTLDSVILEREDEFELETLTHDNTDLPHLPHILRVEVTSNGVTMPSHPVYKQSLAVILNPAPSYLRQTPPCPTLPIPYSLPAQSLPCIVNSTDVNGASPMRSGHDGSSSPILPSIRMQFSPVIPQLDSISSDPRVLPSVRAVFPDLFLSAMDGADAPGPTNTIVDCEPQYLLVSAWYDDDDVDWNEDHANPDPDYVESPTPAHAFVTEYDALQAPLTHAPSRSTSTRSTSSSRPPFVCIDPAPYPTVSANASSNFNAYTFSEDLTANWGSDVTGPAREESQMYAEGIQTVPQDSPPSPPRGLKRALESDSESDLDRDRDWDWDGAPGRVRKRRRGSVSVGRAC